MKLLWKPKSFQSADQKALRTLEHMFSSVPNLQTEGLQFVTGSESPQA